MPNYKVVDADQLDADLKSVADSIRAKAGIEGKLEFPNGFKTAIESITGSGGSSDDVRYVTFMSDDGTEELGKIPVATGYDCPTPKFTATKESTAQFHFTHDYWSSEPNGGTDRNVLKSITENKTVYATFISTLRSYTITYYDDDGITVLKTVTFAYGSTPSEYTPSKIDHAFTGWVPEVTVVTGDASYTAQWMASASFADASWSAIAEVSASGKASELFAVGDTKTVDFNGETITVAIAGFDHDDLADGSGKAGISIVCTTVPSITSQWCSTDSLGFYGESYVHNLLETTFKSYLPAELQAAIKPVAKAINVIDGSVTTITANLWALSLTELGCQHGEVYWKEAEYGILGNKYALFPKIKDLDYYSASTIAYATDATSGDTVEYFTRHIERPTSSYRCICYKTDDKIDENYGDRKENFRTKELYYNTFFGTDGRTEPLHVRFGFCI